MTNDERKRFDRTEGKKVYKLSKSEINIALWAYGFEPEQTDTYTIEQLRDTCKKYSLQKEQTAIERRERQLPLL